MLDFTDTEGVHLSNGKEQERPELASAENLGDSHTTERTVN